MKSLVIYYSQFGNTQVIAERIARHLGEDSKAISIDNFDMSYLTGVKLLIVGSPIRGWMPAEKIQTFLNSLKSGELKGVKAASFDTRVKLFIHGDAALKISKKLEEAGAEIVIKSQAFYVKGQSGPLFPGEIEKAKAWADMIKINLK